MKTHAATYVCNIGLPGKLVAVATVTVALVFATRTSTGQALTTPGAGPVAASSTSASNRDRQIDVECMLIKNALTAVNHGNLTGNYTVLRDLGSPSFRERNSAAQLATIFQRLREQKIDLSPILVLNPQFTEAPSMNPSGQLQLVGFFPTQPSQVHFRLAFQRVQNSWSIDTVSISTVNPNAAGQGVGIAPGVSAANSGYKVAALPESPSAR